MIKQLKKIKGALWRVKKSMEDRREIQAGAHYDLELYSRFATVGSNRSKMGLDAMEAQIIKQYHGIEKGLVMPQFKPCSSGYNIARLIHLIQRYIDQGGKLSNPHVSSGVRCLRRYIDLHNEMGYDISGIITSRFCDDISRWSDLIDCSVRGGDERVKEREFFAYANAPFDEFVRSRRSARGFDLTKNVDLKLLNEAVSMAITTPSVCNRQAWKLHIYQDEEDIKNLLSHQNGNRGFGHLIPTLLVVTMDLRCFDGPIERYQPWIDGGFFSMTLLLALHHLNLGAVSLNWSVLPDQDKGAREAGSIPDHERIIVMIGIGHLVDDFCCCASQRRTPEEIISIHS